MPTQNINVGNGLVPSIQLEGQWEEALKLIGYNLTPLVLLGARKGQAAAANKIKAMVKSNIRRGNVQGSYWPGYSYQYGNRKSRQGFGDKKWLMTGTYYRSITIINRNTDVFVGIPRNAKGKVNNNPLTLGAIANILERGSRAHNIAARPLWGPTFKQFGGKKRVAYHINFHIRKELFLATGLRGLKFN
jgi:hypothetical protein